jgi:hypothetical protein
VTAEPRDDIIKHGTNTLFESLLIYFIINGGRMGSFSGYFASTYPTLQIKKIFTIAIKESNIIATTDDKEVILVKRV